MNYQINSNLPGILCLLDHSPESGKILRELAEKVLRDEQFSQIDIGIREMLAAAVSRWNDCRFCMQSHYRVAIHHLGEKRATDYLLGKFKDEEMKIKGYYLLAQTVNEKGGDVSKKAIDQIKVDHGLNDREIHDVILITSMFNMYNIYVSASGVDRPELTDGEYDQLAQMVVETGYAD